MAEDTDALRTDAPQEEEKDGGPVKSFLEHLEDLRWVLIKSVVALTVAIVICLLGCDKVFTILKWPLERARLPHKKDTQVVTFLFSSNRLGAFTLSAAQRSVFDFGSNQFVTFHIEPIRQKDDTNLFVLGMREDPESSEGQKLGVPIVVNTPAGAFMTAMQVAIYAGSIIASPFVLYFIANFVFPALKIRERKYIYQGLFYAVGLFLTGVAFCYFVLLPVALSASVIYSEWMGLSVQWWQADSYVGFVSKFMLGMGLGFEVPVIVLVLVKIGILNYKILSKARRYVIIINLILGAILTTPEVITQVLMAVPLQVLFEITIWVAWYWERKERKRQAALEAKPTGQ